MLPETVQRFSAAPYERRDDGSSDRCFTEAAGVSCADVRRLRAAVIDDLGDTGVSWWEQHLGPQRRILITEHFIDCLSAIDDNLAEAAIHRMEAEGWWRRESERMSEALEPDDQRGVVLRHPRPETAADLLPNQAAQLHLAGFFRAIGSALDCLGAVVVGVLGLPIDLRRADYGTAERHLDRLEGDDEAVRLQLHAWRRLGVAETQAGPEGWRRWATDYRNMLVHRGRRMLMATLVPREPVVLRPNGLPFAEAVRFLAAEPGKSQIEAFISFRAQDAALAESAEATLNGIFSSTMHFANDVSVILTEVWQRRRDAPNLIEQPDVQWRRPDLQPRPDRFEGYAPGDPVRADVMFASDGRVQRFVAAALATERRAIWEADEPLRG